MRNNWVTVKGLYTQELTATLVQLLTNFNPFHCLISRPFAFCFPPTSLQLHYDPRAGKQKKKQKTHTGLYKLIFFFYLSNQSESVMNAAPSQRPHPLFSWLIPKELINMHEAAISIGTKDRACTLALWRSIRNTKGLLRGKLSVSLALGWADARAHTLKKRKKKKVRSKHT